MCVQRRPIGHGLAPKASSPRGSVYEKWHRQRLQFLKDRVGTPQTFESRSVYAVALAHEGSLLPVKYDALSAESTPQPQANHRRVGM